MPVLDGQYVRPGFYVVQKDVSAPAVIPGIRVAAIAGQGPKTLGRSENLVRSANIYGKEILSNNIVISVAGVSSGSANYRQGVDYQLSYGATADLAYIDWSLKAAVTSGNLGGYIGASTPNTLAEVLNGLQLNLTFVAPDGTLHTLSENNAPGPIVFTGDATGFQGPYSNDATGLAAFINQWVGDLGPIAYVDGTNSFLILKSKSMTVLPGAAATAILGFVPFASASLNYPAAGKAYTANYVSDKLDAEYGPMVFTDIKVGVANYGEPRPQDPKLTTTGTAAGSTNVNNSATSTLQATPNPKWVTNQWAGYYLRITGGLGMGQVRVIVSNTADTLTLSRYWHDLMLPDATSTFVINDVNVHSLIKGVLGAKATGATVFIASQYQDDIFNADNIKAAIDALEQDVNGFRPYTVTLMRGFGSTEFDPVAYLSAHMTKMSNDKKNKWRRCTYGLAQGNEDFTTFTQAAAGVLSSRMILSNITDVQQDFGFGLEHMDGSYVAAALAGVICANEDAGQPMTGRAISAAFSVANFADPFKDEEKDEMAAAGVTIIERQGDNLVIVDFLTTDPRTQLSQDVRLGRVEDNVSKVYKDGMLAATVGQRLITNGQGFDLIGRALTTFNLLTTQLVRPSDPSNQQVDHVEGLDIHQDPSESDKLDLFANVYLTPEIKIVLAILGFNVA